METVFDKISAELTFVSNIMYHKIEISQMLTNKYSEILILHKNPS